MRAQEAHNHILVSLCFITFWHPHRILGELLLQAMGSALRAVRPAASSLGKRRKSAFKETKATEGANGVLYPNKATPKRPVPWSFAGNALGPTMRLAASNGIAEGASVLSQGAAMPVLPQPSPNTPGFAPPVAPGPLLALASAQGPVTPAPNPGVALALSQNPEGLVRMQRWLPTFGLHAALSDG